MRIKNIQKYFCSCSDNTHYFNNSQRNWCSYVPFSLFIFLPNIRILLLFKFIVINENYADYFSSNTVKFHIILKSGIPVTLLPWFSEVVLPFFVTDQWTVRYEVLCNATTLIDKSCILHINWNNVNKFTW